jgi:DNA polymerase IV
MELPLKYDGSLRWLFLDLNAYFASVEQAENPELLGKPVAVCPTHGDSATIIAASYEAKPYGIRTGTRVGEAKQLCPDIILVPATPALYVAYHRAVLAAVESVLPIDKVCSIDELRIRLLGEERTPKNATRLAHQLKQAIRDHVAPSLQCSIGIAPNAWLAKLATEFQKPDGLVFIHPQELPDRLQGLKLTEFPGINKRMQARLNASGVFTSDDLIRQNPKQLSNAFGSVIGERWYYLLRGYDVQFENETGKTLGHSHVLPPDMRTDQDSRAVLLRLTHKACSRLRATGVWATHVSVSVTGRIRSWHAESRIPPTQDAISLAPTIERLWRDRDFSQPTKVSITFHNLKKGPETTPSLFEPTKDYAELGHAVDTVNNKFGKNSVFLASLDKAKNTATEKIAFNKTWLFSEGKDDHVWPDTFRGLQPERDEN